MQPGTPVNNRSNRFRIFAHSMILGIVLVTTLMVGVWPPLAPDCLAADPAVKYEPIPVRRWSADEVRALPDGPQRIERELHRQGEYSRRWNLIHDLVGHQHVSTKSSDILRGRGLGPALLDKEAGQSSRLSGDKAEDTLRVLIIRIAFETNRDSNLTTIDPSGDFVLDPLTDPKPLEVDPPPRNKAFFESHLQGLSEFYKYMSGGRLNIVGEVLPEGSDDSYKLTDVADYGPGAGNFWTLESLERLVQDIMVKADQETQADGSANLAEYDDNSPFTYIIFVHSGSDWQSDINGDSPNDIPTFFVKLGEPIDLIGTNANGDPGQLSECSIIPETTNQDDYPGSIAAAFYHEFGHALGLVDVYSTYSGLPSVGIWDLMDSGTNLPVTMGTITAENDTFVISATGVLPPSLSAWNKWFLGWLEMGELDGRSGEYQLPAVGVPQDQYRLYPQFKGFQVGDPQAFRAGLSPREWFLLENRWVPAGVAETPFSDLRFERDEATGVIQYLAGELVTITGSRWMNSGLYDYFMPPGGILVWHVNSDRIEAGLADNTINQYGDGLKLVEADGIQDIGVLEAYVIGWYGSYLDPFGGTDPGGNPTGFNTLHVEGFPSSRSFDRSWTGLSLENIEPRFMNSSIVMTFNGNQGPIGPGFPYEIPPLEPGAIPGREDIPSARPIDPASLTPVVLGNGQQVMIFADTTPEGWEGGEFPASLYNLWTDGNVKWTSVSGERDDMAFQELGAPLSGSPFVQPRSDNDGVDLVWGTRDGRVGLTHLPQYDMPSVLWDNQVGETLSGGPVPVTWQGDSDRILCPVPAGQMFLLDQLGNEVGDPLTLAFPMKDEIPWTKFGTAIPGFASSDLIPVYSSQGWWLVSQNDEGLDPSPSYHPYDSSNDDSKLDPTVRMAVVEAADNYQVHIFQGDRELGVWGVSEDGAVTELGEILTLRSPLVTDPAVADVDGDGLDELILLTADRIHAVKPNGIAVRGFPVRFYDLFPLPDSTRVMGPAVVADGTGDGVNEIYFNTDGGHLVGLDASGRLLPRLPMRWGDRGTPGLAVGGERDDRVLWLVSPGGYDGPPLDRQLVNGRVTAYGLADAVTAEDRTSEWQGPAGGSQRRGVVGEPRNLGPSGPASAETDLVVFYPNPVVGDDVTVRFFSAGDSPARVTIYNLEGEEVANAEIPVTAGALNEFSLPLPGVASGLYLARLQYEASGGMTIKTLTLAVEK